MEVASDALTMDALRVHVKAPPISAQSMVVALGVPTRAAIKVQKATFAKHTAEVPVAWFRVCM